MLAEDGSGKGAGLVSAIAKRINARIDGESNGHHHNEIVVNGKEKNGHEYHTNGFHNGITSGTNGFAKH